MAGKLTVIGVPHAAAQKKAADNAVHRLAARGVRVARILPSTEQAERTLKRLADAGTPSLGIETTTLDGWVRRRWELFGDTRRIAGTALRRAAALAVLGGTAWSHIPSSSSGMVACLEDVVREGSGAPAFESARTDDPRLSPAEQELISACKTYAHLLSEHGALEAGLACSLLPSAMGNSGWMHLVVEGPTSFTDAQVDLLVQAAHHCGVTLVARLGNHPAFALSNTLVERLETACAICGVNIERIDVGSGEGCTDSSGAPDGGGSSPWRSEEIAQLAERIFSPEPSEVVDTLGDVRFCFPAGRYAEPELLAKTIKKLVYDGHAPRDIAVACTDPLALASSVAGRLAETPGRAISCCAAGQVELAATNASHLLGGLLELAEAAQTPGPAPELRARAADLARNPLTGIATHLALDLDRAWRQNRATNAEDFLNDLVQASVPAELETLPADAAETKEQVETLFGRIVALVREGDITQAASALAGSIAGIGITARTERAAANRIVTLAQAYAALGLPAFTRESFERLVASCTVPVSWLSVPANDVAAQSVAAVMDSNPNAVQFLRPSEVENRSFSALILCDLTADAYSVADRADARATLWDKLGLTASPRQLEKMRWQMRCVLEAARETLVLERRLQDEDAKELRPAALLEELVDCYRDDPTNIRGLDKVTGLPVLGDLPCTTLGEERFAELASPVTLLPATIDMPVTHLAACEDGSRELLIRPNQVWSPSALELYLSCPLRWLHERRIPNDGIDAGFGSLEFGSFNHRVLHLFHERLPQLGLERIYPNTDQSFWAPLFETCFDEVLDNQVGVDNPLVPVTVLEREKIEMNRRNLRGCVQRDSLLPLGFIPRRHEWRFGYGEDAPVPYGSILLHGTIDRIDEDENQHVLVIDYKGSLGDGYEPPRPKKDQDPADIDPLPLHSQALMYAGALRRVEPQATVAGALYVSYSKPKASGFLDTTILGPLDSDKRAYLGERCAVHAAADGESGLVELLDYVEGEVADAMDRLRDGDVYPRPRFKKNSCLYCSVTNCSKRVM